MPLPHSPKFNFRNPKFAVLSHLRRRSSIVLRLSPSFLCCPLATIALPATVALPFSSVDLHFSDVLSPELSISLVLASSPLSPELSVSAKLSSFRFLAS